MSHARTTLTTLHSTLVQRRAARRQHLQLQRELAAYDTPAARTDLTATLARHTPEESEPVQRILTSQAYARIGARNF
jgi:hypothetical protein